MACVWYQRDVRPPPQRASDVTGGGHNGLQGDNVKSWMAVRKHIHSGEKSLIKSVIVYCKHYSHMKDKQQTIIFDQF